MFVFFLNQNNKIAPKKRLKRINYFLKKKYIYIFTPQIVRKLKRKRRKARENLL